MTKNIPPDRGLSRYIHKAGYVYKSKGLSGLARHTGRFVIMRTPFHRLLPPPPVYHINPHDVEAWYQRQAKKVTIVIPSYNDWPLLKKCLQSIKETTRFRKVNVIIVDDYSEAAHRQKLTELAGPHVKVILRDANGGFAKAVNTGLRAAKTGDVVLLNSDTIVQTDWLKTLQFGAYQFDPQTGIIGAMLLYDNGTIQFGGTFRHLEQADWFDHLYRHKPKNFGPANVPSPVLAVTGACMYIKRAVIDQIGYFDEKFGMAFEDVDYCLRAWQAGFRCLYVPLAKVTHLESATRGLTQGPRELASQKYFWQKWRKFFQRQLKTKNGKPKIIYVCNDTGVAGGIRMIFEHLNHLHDRGYEVELYTLGKDPKWTTLKVPHRSFKSYEELCAKLATEDAIKVATWWETAKWVWLASVTRGIPVFYVQDIESSYYRDDKVMQEIVRAAYRPEFNYLTISEYNKQVLKSEFDRDSVNVTCGISSQIFHPIKNTTRRDDVLIAIGRKHYLKNFPMTFKAWQKTRPQPDLWLFGFETDIVKPNPKITYHYLPTDRQINDLFNQATVFVQTSIHEGFCLPPLEAMAAGLPVITTDSHGNRDYIKPGENCLLVEQNNVPQLTKLIEQLFGDKALQEKLRTEGYKTAAKYDWPIITDKLEKFYQGVMKAYQP